MSITCGNGRCGSQSEDDAGHLHVPEGQDIPSYQAQPPEHKDPSLPLPHLKDENVFRVRRGAWSKTQAPTSEQSATNPAMTIPTKHQPHD